MGPPKKNQGSSCLSLTGPKLWDIVGLMSSFDIFPLDNRLDGEKDIEIQNPFSGQKATVPGYAAAVYDVIMGAQVTHDYDLVQKGCDWFSRKFPKQYMVLLD